MWDISHTCVQTCVCCISLLSFFLDWDRSQLHLLQAFHTITVSHLSLFIWPVVIFIHFQAGKPNTHTHTHKTNNNLGQLLNCEKWGIGSLWLWCLCVKCVKECFFHVLDTRTPQSTQALELIRKKNWNLRGSGVMPPSPHQKIKIYAIWGYPEVIFMEIISTFLFAPPPTRTTPVTTRWRHPHLRTSNDGSPPQAPPCALHSRRIETES